MFFTGASGFEEGYAKKDNLEIYYRDYGPSDGIPVLLVMGLGGQLTFWPPYMIKSLQDSGYRPIAYDNRDMGLSSRFNSNPTFLSNYLKYYLNMPIKSEYKLDNMANDATFNSTNFALLIIAFKILSIPAPVFPLAGIISSISQPSRSII